MVKEILFLNLDAELARARISKADLAAKIGISPTSMSSKTTGKTEFTLDELEKIKEELETATESEFTLDYLFARSRATNND